MNNLIDDLEIGHVLSLKIRFNNSNLISQTKHPYLIIDINRELNYIEIAQFDSLSGKEYKAAMKSNKTVYCDNPIETVINKDSYIQLDNTFRIESFSELVKYRWNKDKLSNEKLQSVISAYWQYREEYEIKEHKNVYMDKLEILSLN